MALWSRGMNRRGFLAAAAGGSLAAAIIRQDGAWTAYGEDRAAKWRMRLSTSSVHYPHLPIEQACERISAVGFEAIDIWSAYAQCRHLDDALNRLGPQGLRELLQRTHLQLFAFSVYVGGFPRYAALLGGCGGGVAVRGSTGPCPADELTARMRDFLDRLRPEIELAEKHNCRLAIENHGNALLDSLDSLKAFVDLNRSPRVGIALAPYHLQRARISVPEAIAVCGSQLLFFYAWQQGSGTDQLPGHGPADFSPWIAALRKIRYSGYVNPFMHGDVEPERMSAALAKSRDYLRGIVSPDRG